MSQQDDLRGSVLRGVRPLHDVPQAPGWNHDDLRDLLGPGPRRLAAVLVPLVARDAGLHVLLTRRNDQLTHHAGQVSFPGGGIESNDESALAAALRETHEEIGIAPSLVEPIGYLDAYETVSNYCVTPVVAWLDTGYRATPDPREVAEIFEVPLRFFFDPSNRHPLRIRLNDRVREVYEFHYGGQRIWGATAAMLLNLIRRMETAA